MWTYCTWEQKVKRCKNQGGIPILLRSKGGRGGPYSVQSSDKSEIVSGLLQDSMYHMSPYDQGQHPISPALVVPSDYLDKVQSLCCILHP